MYNCSLNANSSEIGRIPTRVTRGLRNRVHVHENQFPSKRVARTLIMHRDATRFVHTFRNGWPVADQLSSRPAAMVLALPSESLAEPRSETRTVTGSQGHTVLRTKAYVHHTRQQHTVGSLWSAGLPISLSLSLVAPIVIMHHCCMVSCRAKTPREPPKSHEKSCGA